MSALSILLAIAYLITFLIATVILATILPLNISIQTATDGLDYKAAAKIEILLNLLSGTVSVDPEGGSLRLKLTSLQLYSTQWTRKKQEPEEETKETEPEKKRDRRTLFAPSRRLYSSLTRRIRVTRLDVDLTAGLSDPYTSGILFGATYPAIEAAQLLLPPLSVSLTPVFIVETLQTRVDGRITLVIILLVVPILRFLLSKEYREYKKSGNTQTEES